MDPNTKKASAIVFTLLVLLGVGMAIMLAVNQIVEGNLMVRDGKDGDATLRRLFVGEVVHAGQYLPPADANDRHTHRDHSRLPVTYWHPKGPVGETLAKVNWFRGADSPWRADARLPASLFGHGFSPGPLPAGQLVAAWSEPPLGAIPLKAGALAGYARPFQIVDFYEPSPAIHELSFPKAGEPKFTFLRDARERGAAVRVLQGKVRELLVKEAPRRFYQALFVDAVRGELGDFADELLTVEGMKALMATVADKGILAYHVSNKEYDLVPIVSTTAQAQKYVCVLAEDQDERGKGHYSSEWVLVARGGDALRHLNRVGGNVRWTVPVARGGKAWTDAGPRDRTGLERRKH